MSGVVSGVGKVFSAVGNTTAKVTKSIAGIGATMFTAGAATGAPSIAQGGLSNMMGQGTLGKILQGAVSRAVPGAVMGAAVGAMTGQGLMKGAMMGGLGGAAFGGAEGAGLFKTASMQKTASVPFGGAQGGGDDPGIDYTATGSINPPSGGGLMPNMGVPKPANSVSRMDMNWDARTGAQGVDVMGAIDRSQPSAMPTNAASTGGGLFQKGLDFLGSERGGQLLAGLGRGGMEYLEAKRIAEEKERDRQFVRDEQQRVTDSYKGTVVPSNVVANETAKMQAKPRYMFDPGAGRIVMA